MPPILLVDSNFDSNGIATIMLKRDVSIFHYSEIASLR